MSIVNDYEWLFKTDIMQIFHDFLLNIRNSSEMGNSELHYMRFRSSHSQMFFETGILKSFANFIVCELWRFNPTYERYILGSTPANRHSLRFPKNDVSHFNFSSLCLNYRQESLQTRIFLKYIDHANTVIKF